MISLSLCNKTKHKTQTPKVSFLSYFVSSSSSNFPRKILQTKIMLKSKTQQKSRKPSFSSSLLDEIYNSIDSKPIKTQSFVNPTKKQSTSITKDRFFSSLSSSSDSNSSIFSSSDTELTLNHPKKLSSRPLCFGPSKPKPRKTEEKPQNRNFRVYDDYDYLSEHQMDEKSRNRKSLGKLKTPKTPASPAGRIVNFLNSLFTNSKQSMAVKKMNYDDESVFVGKFNEYPSGCSSASSFSRSCLNKTSVVKSSDRVKRTVRFSPVNVVVSEKFNRRSEENDGFVNGDRLKKTEDGGRRSVEEIAREFLRDYHKNHDKDHIVKNSYRNGLMNYEEEDEEDEDEDEGSDSSSDLFELDLVGNHFNGYGDELPVYETTFAGLIL